MIVERRRFGPVAGPPAKRVTVVEGERFVVPPTLSQPEADRIARERIQEGLARPVDSHLAEIEAAHLVWIPLWRVDATVDAAPLGPRAVTRVVLARRLLPVDPSGAVTLDPQELSALRDVAPREGEWIEADVARDEAEFEVGSALRRRAIPARVLRGDIAVRVRGAAQVHLGVWLRRYRYEGEASGGAVEECHVAVHGRTGAVVSERHPPAWRALAGRVRRLFNRG